MAAPLPWAWANRMLAAVGGRPILTVWIGLNLVAVLWLRGFEPLADSERYEHQSRFLRVVSVLDWPGLWLCGRLLLADDAPPLVEVLASATGVRPGHRFAYGDRELLVAWLSSAAIAWTFWQLLVVPLARRLDRWAETQRDPYLR